VIIHLLLDLRIYPVLDLEAAKFDKFGNAVVKFLGLV
jgi:hypothetical protein